MTQHFDPLASPVFILGMHRSGTTLLYEMLARSECWNTLWAWHVAAYDEIEPSQADLAASQTGLTRRFEQAGLETRGVDSIKVRIETKEEYGFILDNHGQGPRITRKSFPLFRRICETVQRTHAQQRPLLLKNPWDFGNAPLIQELMPSARFVYIHRRPEEAVNSMWKFLRQALLNRNEYMAMLSTQYERLLRTRVRLGTLRWVINRQPGIFVNGLIRWFGKACDRFLTSVSQVPDRQRIEITYDQLCAAPETTIQAILNRFQMSGADVDYAAMIDRRESRLEELVASRLPAIRRRFAAYLEHLSGVEAGIIV